MTHQALIDYYRWRLERAKRTIARYEAELAAAEETVLNHPQTSSHQQNLGTLMPEDR